MVLKSYVDFTRGQSHKINSESAADFDSCLDSCQIRFVNKLHVYT